MKQFEDNNEDAWMAAEPAVDYAQTEGHYTTVLSNYDKINGVGPQSVEELMDDLKQAERDMKDPSKWDTLDHFLSDFKHTHASWFK